MAFVKCIAIVWVLVAASWSQAINLARGLSVYDFDHLEMAIQANQILRDTKMNVEEIMRVVFKTVASSGSKFLNLAASRIEHLGFANRDGRSLRSRNIEIGFETVTRPSPRYL